MSTDFPSRGFVFWPVGTGDSTTVVVDPGVTVQVDLHHLASSEEEDDPHAGIVGHLVDMLPEVDGKPYLSVFVLTHPDKDHCLGFKNLLGRVVIGELWFSPRVFREFRKDLCDDAQVFQDEAMRRVRATARYGGDPPSGDRVRIIGYDDLLREDDFRGFPATCLTIPGNEVHKLDGVEYPEVFRAFIHAPFKEHAEGERNDTSVGMQVSLYNGSAVGRAMLLGDHCYPTVKKIFEISKPEDVQFNLLLAMHHCSKSVMYWQDPGEDEARLKQDVMDALEAAADTPGYIIASSEPIPVSNNKGDNPPHAKAKAEYEKIVPDAFICTQEHPDVASPVPIAFAVTENGVEYVGPSKMAKGSLTDAATKARGTGEPPAVRVGFGQ